MLGTTSSSSTRPFALAAAIGGFAILALYLVILLAEGDNDWGPVIVVAAFIATAAGAAALGASATSLRFARRLLQVSTVAFGAIGIIALFSIGILLIAVAILAMMEVARIDRRAAREQSDSSV